MLLACRMNEAKNKHEDLEDQIEAMWLAYWKFAFKHKEYYQLMFGLGMPGCETVKQIPEMAAFTEIVLAPVRDMLAKSKNANADPWTMRSALDDASLINCSALARFSAGANG